MLIWIACYYPSPSLVHCVCCGKERGRIFLISVSLRKVVHVPMLLFSFCVLFLLQSHFDVMANVAKD